MKLIRFLFLCILGTSFIQSSAQDNYLAEIGIVGGGSFYLGDANNQLFQNTQPAYGAFLRYKFDTRLALRAELNRTTVAGTFQNVSNQVINFFNPVYAVDLCGEFNFFDLQKNEYQRFSKPYSPYIFAGLGLMTDLYVGQKLPGISIPFGVGMKLKLNDRWNLNAQWSNRILLSDHMEGIDQLNNPYGLNGSNILNNDILSTITIGLSYDFWKKPCNCNNNSNNR